MQKEVNNRIMYRIIKNKYLSDEWEVGNNFTIDEKYNSFGYYSINHIYKQEYNNKEIDDLCEDAYNGAFNKEELLKIKDIIKMFYINYTCDHKEYLLENIRKDEFPNLISRMHCLFLTDKESLPYWKNVFRNMNTSLFKIEVSGLMFLSHSCLLPQRRATFFEQENQARCYWQNKLKENPYHITNDREYLFQGKVKVLKKYENDKK